MLVACSLVYAAPAAAQATRTWVSGVGDDVNPCSRTAPCKTFAGAISKTAAGGEIDCLDPGGFGTLTITKSITVDCSGTFGSTLNSGGINGFVINDSATGTPGTVRVILRGLSINGAGTTPGLNGIRFISGASLVVENVIIQNSAGGFGVSFQPTAAARLFLTNVTITGNGNGSSGGGVLVQPTGTGSARVNIKSSRIANNGGQAVRVDTTGNTGAGNQVTISDSVLSENVFGVVVVTPAATTLAVATLINSVVSHNTSNGIVANGGTAQVRVTGTTITGNGSGGAGQGGLFVGGGGNIVTYGDNPLFGNAPDGTFTVGPIPKS
ncbi:hypothetical protein MZO42_13685 [Sphingomonas psychrotolerans]|uniref:Right handed beta helix domain-containing protein n=1 Tax=Sphingomonas psychrotolerans TaxID=1327635 RepID=A0ABU3N5E0_9SPHN|nr:right-handed parallel beta-helix repeat-containing protein [Sphingomonas psychrotolerans]MDT8759749.1 hypothetical protein [Sphingomonas psychrotolerans]